MFEVVGCNVPLLVCVRLLSVHCGLHASIFLSGELGIQEGRTVVFFISFVGSTVFICCCNFSAFTV